MLLLSFQNAIYKWKKQKKTEEHEAFIINDGVKRLVGVQCKKSISNSKHMLYYGWKCLQ